MKRLFVIFAILGSMAVLDILYWRWASRKLKPLKNPKPWLWALHLFMFVQITYLLGLMFLRGPTRAFQFYMPKSLIVTIYLWHLLVLPAWAAVMLLAKPISKWANRKPAEAVLTPLPEPIPTGPSRRELLGALTVSIPPLVTFAGLARAVPQLSDFQVNRHILTFKNLPPNLDGLTITQLADVHIGRFTRGKVLDKIVDATNSLKSDLILMPGDLIDFYLSDLPTGIDLVKRLDARHGVYLCQGNHDLIENPNAFDERCKSAGLELLNNESRVLNIKNEQLQLLGVKWPTDGREISDEMTDVKALVNKDLFSILIAHHPHSFDGATRAGIDLTLAGHTHGGQLNITKNIGGGSILFKYWTGLYHQRWKGHDAQLFVTNGVGNWFPLRINAPAEIVHLTLKRG